MKFDDLVKMIVEADETQAPGASAPGAPLANAATTSPKMAAKTAGSGDEQSTGKIYFCEIATKAIDNATKHKTMFPYMDRIIAQYADGIKKLQAAGVGKLDYGTLVKEPLDGDTYEYVASCELPTGEKIDKWPIALSVEIDDENIQKKMEQKYEKMRLRTKTNKLAGGGEKGKEAEDLLDALG